MTGRSVIINNKHPGILYISEFEQAFAAACEAKHGVACTNGTTALHLAYTAKGGLAGMVLFTPKLWDIAAGCLIAEQAGAIVSDWQGHPLWPVDVTAYEGGAFPSVMCNPVIHEELLAMINGA